MTDETDSPPAQMTSSQMGGVAPKPKKSKLEVRSPTMRSMFVLSLRRQMFRAMRRRLKGQRSLPWRHTPRYGRIKALLRAAAVNDAIEASCVALIVIVVMASMLLLWLTPLILISGHYVFPQAGLPFGYLGAMHSRVAAPLFFAHVLLPPVTLLALIKSEALPLYVRRGAIPLLMFLCLIGLLRASLLVGVPTTVADGLAIGFLWGTATGIGWWVLGAASSIPMLIVSKYLEYSARRLRPESTVVDVLCWIYSYLGSPNNPRVLDRADKKRLLRALRSGAAAITCLVQEPGFEEKNKGARAALLEMQEWLIFPDPDRIARARARLEVSINALADGEWGRLPQSLEPVPRPKWWKSTLPSVLRHTLIALLPALTVVAISVATGTVTLGHPAAIFAIAWPLLIVLSVLDRDNKATNLLKEGVGMLSGKVK